MFGGINPTVDGRPATINAYAQWTGDYYGHLFNVIATFQLRRNASNDAWVGESATHGKRIKLESHDTPDPNLVDVRIYLYDDDAPYDLHEWPNVATTTRPPWGTKPLTHTAAPHRDLVEAQLLG